MTAHLATSRTSWLTPVMAAAATSLELMNSFPLLLLKMLLKFISRVSVLMAESAAVIHSILYYFAV